MKKNSLCLVTNIRAVALSLAVVCSTISGWATPAVDDTFIEGDLKYTVTSVSPYECSVKCTDKSIAEVQIPETVSYNEVELKVTSIGEAAFVYCMFLSSITIPSSVTSIGICAFEGCEFLSSITIPSRVTSIGKYAFGNCVCLQKVTCKGTTPPICDSSAFGGVDVSSCKLMVPKGSVDTYSYTSVWEDFGDISTFNVKKINIEYNDGTTSTLSIDRTKVKRITFTEE